jgi:hypothetical protein
MKTKTKTRPTTNELIDEQKWYKGYWPQGWTMKDTGRHGYLYIDQDSQKNIPSYFRKARYEEDCEWAIAVYFNKHNFALSIVTKAESMLRNWFPTEWEKYIGRRLLKGESTAKDNNYYAIMENIGKWIGTTAYGDWCFDIPEGYVYLRLVRVESHHATYSISIPQGQEMYALVTSEKYKSGGFYDYEDLIPYERNEDYYTWREYTKATGQPRYK